MNRSLSERISQLQKKILQALLKSQNPERHIRLICVSKGQDESAILEVQSLGYREFGENYAQELEQKARCLSSAPIKWIFIGTLQSNKISHIVRYAAEIQTVTSEKHVRLIAKYATEYQKTPFPVSISIKTGQEETKSGISFEQARSLAQTIKNDFPELKLLGLMTLPPPIEELDLDDKGIPFAYHPLKDMALQIGDGLLSLGMSNDFEAAIKAGSDCIRIGSTIFGEREKKNMLK